MFRWWKNRARRKSTPRFVTKESVTAAMNECSSGLERDLREVAQQAAADPRIGMLVFLTEVGSAFDRFPLRLSAWSAEGQEVDSELWDYEFLPGRSLLPAAEAYPLGRVDWIGVNTMPDADIVDRVLRQGLRGCWSKAKEDIETPMAFVQHMDDDAFIGRRDVMDLATGENRTIELLG